MQGWAVIVASASSRTPKLRTWGRAPTVLLDFPNRPSRFPALAPCPSLLVHPHSAKRSRTSHSLLLGERSSGIDTDCQIGILSKDRSFCPRSQNGTFEYGNAFPQVNAEVTYFANRSAFPIQTTYSRAIRPHDLPNPCCRMDTRRFGSMAVFAISR